MPYQTHASALRLAIVDDQDRRESDKPRPSNVRSRKTEYG